MLLLNLYSSTIVFQESLKFIVVHMDCGHCSGADLHVFLILSGSHSKSIEGRKWPAHLCKSIVTQYFILLIKFGLWTSVLHSMWLSVYIIASRVSPSAFNFMVYNIHGGTQMLCSYKLIHSACVFKLWLLGCTISTFKNATPKFILFSILLQYKNTLPDNHALS